MTLVDTGPLVAVIDRGDDDHQACLEALSRLPRPLTTTWPVVTEVMYLLGDRGGWRAQHEFWSLVTDGHLHLEELTEAIRRRISQLMEKYQDLPMDLADASLVAVAEARGISQIVTLDSDFSVYRLHGRKAFKILP